MSSVKCPRCGLVMALVQELVGHRVSCPQCNAKFTMRRPAQAEPNSTEVDPPPTVNQAPTQPPPPPPPPPQSNAATARAIPTGTNAVRRYRRAVQARFLPASSWIDIFDFKLQRYLTPWIARITWAMALSLGVFWIVILTLLLVAALAPDLPATSPSTRNEQYSRSTRQLSPQLKAPDWLTRRVLAIGAYVTSCVGILAIILWIRAFLETVIVIFNIAMSLEEIEKTLTEPTEP